MRLIKCALNTRELINHALSMRSNTCASLCGTNYPRGMALDGMEATKTRRKSYTHEFKLEVVAFYSSNNPYQPSKKFSLNTKIILRWIQNEELIDTSKKGNKHVALIYPG